MDTPQAGRGSRLYWRLTLLLPVLGAGLGFFFEGYGIVLVAGFVAVAIPYVVFAASMWWVIGRLRAPRQFFVCAALAPLLLAALAVITLVPVVWSRTRGLSFDQMLLTIAWTVPWILAIGYAYVALACLGYLVGLALGRFRGWNVRLKPSPHAQSADRWSR